MTPSRQKGLAAVCEAVGKPLVLRSVAVPDPQPGELLVQVSCCTICGSDLHTFTGRRTAPLPSVLGHEIVGRINQIGDESATDAAGQTLEVGDRITWSVAASCGDCPRCMRGMPQKCLSLFKYGHERIGPANEHTFSGGLAEYCLLKPGTTCVRLPDTLSDTVASPLSCATATVMAAIRHAGTLRDRRVLVLGAGMLGLTACAVASSQGASRVRAVDVDKAREQQALDFGAADSGTDPDGLYDCILELSGQPEAVARAIKSADVGGSVILVGSVSPSPAIDLDPEQVVRRLLSIHGVHNYLPGDLVAAVDFLSEFHEDYPFEDLVERQYPLAQVNEAFEFALQHRPIRVAVTP